MKRLNAWHQAIIAQLHAAGGSLSAKQIWQRMEAAGFQHASKKPRSTIGARIAELVKERTLKRVGSSSYRLTQAPSKEVTS